ncbi:MAG: hypothetical protein ACYS3S_07115 [Planctomycetota bacterium]|jgi:hypothetical protein
MAAILNGQMAFSLKQDLAVAEQETPDDDLIEEAYRQRGLILLRAETMDERFRRTVEEYLLTDEAVKTVQGRDAITYDKLKQLHDEAVANRQTELHVSGEVEIESDLLNRNVAIPGGASMIPYDLPEDPIPLPAFVLYWPTIIPVLSEDEVKPGNGWTGSITVQIGAGLFPLTYSVTLVEYVEDDPLLRIDLDEQEPVAMVGEDADIALHLKPQGTWTVRISHEDGLCEETSGEMVFSVRARYKEAEEDEEEIDLEVLKWENKFTVERIPVTFDDNKIYPVAWKAKASEPEAEKPPLPPKQDRGAKSWWKRK